MRDPVVEVAVSVELSHRDVAVLRSCGAGKVKLVNGTSVVPDVVIDGLAYCDSLGANRLISTGLLRAHHVVPVGQSVKAVLTAVGQAALRLAETAP